MQEFLTNNTVNCNLMSLTGYRTLVILEALMESPKSIEEINNCLFNNQYIKEKFSSDTLRLYINSLRAIGCQITAANKTNKKKYELVSHPFNYDIPQPQLKAIAKVCKTFYQELNINKIRKMEDLFLKISKFISNENTKDFLLNILKLKNIDRRIIDDLDTYCRHKNQIVFLYDSPKSGRKEIEIIADKLSFKSDKLYLWGSDLIHNQYSYFKVDRILKICSVNLRSEDKKFLPMKVRYEFYGNYDDFNLEPDEIILQKDNKKLLIEVISQNEFSLMQRILSFSNNCKVIEPVDLIGKLLKKLNLMGKIYG